MIIVVNSKITDARFWNFVRYNLDNNNRFDVAKYCFASFAPLDPIVSKYIFHLDLAEFADRQQEMQDWITSVLPAEKCSIHWNRCNNIADWRALQVELDTIDDDIVFPCTWEDHIFWDSDITTLARGIELIKQDPNYYACVLTSHYPECMRYLMGMGTEPELSEDGLYAHRLVFDDSCLRIMKREFLDWYIAHDQDPNKTIFRMEQFLPPPGPANVIYQPMKEQFRHFDGYSAVGIGGDIVAPLDIPPGFFERNVKIRYGFDDYADDAVNINPTRPLRTVDANGVDYKFALEDIPAFWLPFVSDTQTAPGIDHAAMTRARNQHYIDMTQINFSSGYGVFNDSVRRVDVSWLQPHLLAE